MYDIVIIGAGVSGCAIARELSRYQARICVLEREEDVCCGTSKANSAIVHAGFDAPRGSLMAKLNVEGNRMMDALSRDLDFPFRRIGSMVVCLKGEDRGTLQTLLENGVANGVPDLRIVEGDELRALEPNVSEDAAAALYAPTGGIVCPFNLTIALAENAAANGVEFRFNTPVTALTPAAGGWTVQTPGGAVEARCVVNAAGVYADALHNMVSIQKLRITPRKGEYCLLDHAAADVVRHTLFHLPNQFGKGVLVTPTVHGNVILGPTADDISDREGVQTTLEGLDKVTSGAQSLVPSLPLRQVITSFAGLRAHEDGHEFVIGPAADAPGFFDCAGIESPGLSSAPAIGVMVAELLQSHLSLAADPAFQPRRTGILDPKTLSKPEWAALIRREPAYGRIVCRCESVTEGEILDAIRRPLGAKSLDGVKRRTRAGMGRCQSGFCSPRVMELLARELGVSQAEITKHGPGSALIAGVAKDRI